jgi:tetratricopeptide (TPR) repeat protein
LTRRFTFLFPPAVGALVFLAASLWPAPDGAQPPASVSEFCSQAESLRQEQRLPELLSLCEQALASSPAVELAAAAHRFLGEYYEELEFANDMRARGLALGDFSKAEAEYQKAIELAPQTEQAAWATVGLAECKRLHNVSNNDDYRSALATYQRVVVTWPGTEAARWAQVRIARYYTSEKQWDRAEAEYKKAIENPKATHWMARAAVMLAEHYRQMGQALKLPAFLSKAAAQFEKALQDYGPRLGETHSADAQTKIAMCHRLLGDNAAAAQAYQKVLDNYPASKWCAEGHRGLAVMASEEKRYDDAIAHYQAIIDGGYRTSPAGGMDWAPYARYYMAECYGRKGDMTRALQELRAVVDSAPDTKEARNALHLMGCFLKDAGRCGEARTAFREVISRWPGSPEAALAQLSIGQAYRAEGKQAEGLEAYQKVLDIYPDKASYKPWREAASEWLARLRAAEK